MSTPEEQAPVVEEQNYVIKAESSTLVQGEVQESVEMLENEVNSDDATEYKYTHQESIIEEHPEEELIFESTESGQQYIYQNGEGGNLYVISTVSTGEDGVQQEGQYIATSAELFEAAGGGAQIVDLSSFTSASDIINGQQIIINGVPMILQNAEMMDESGSNPMMEQEIVIPEMGEVDEPEIKHEMMNPICSDYTNGEQHLLQFEGMELGIATNPDNLLSSQHLVYYQNSTDMSSSSIGTPASISHPPKLGKVKAEAIIATPESIDEAIAAVVRESTAYAQRQQVFEKQLEATKCLPTPTVSKDLNFKFMNYNNSKHTNPPSTCPSPSGPPVIPGLSNKEAYSITTGQATTLPASPVGSSSSSSFKSPTISSPLIRKDGNKNYMPPINTSGSPTSVKITSPVPAPSIPSTASLGPTINNNYYQSYISLGPTISVPPPERKSLNCSNYIATKSPAPALPMITTSSSFKNPYSISSTASTPGANLSDVTKNKNCTLSSSTQPIITGLVYDKDGYKCYSSSGATISIPSEAISSGLISKDNLTNYNSVVSTVSSINSAYSPLNKTSLTNSTPKSDVKPTSSNPVQPQPHTVIMVKDKRKRNKLETMALPFSYSGQSFSVQAQKLILNVLHFFKTHKLDESIDAFRTPQEKAARVLNVSSSVISKIRRNYLAGRLIPPGQNRQMTKRVLDKVNTGDEIVIRKIISDLIDTKVTPTIPMILAEARERIGFTGSRTSFRRILHRMGYMYGKIDKQIMIESMKDKVKTDKPLPTLHNSKSLGSAPITSAMATNTVTVANTEVVLPKLIDTGSLSRTPPQINFIKQENSSGPPIINLNYTKIIPSINSDQQPRQIIIQSTAPSSQPQFYTIQPNQLNELNLSHLTNNSSQKKIIHLINTNNLSHPKAAKLT